MSISKIETIEDIESSKELNDTEKAILILALGIQKQTDKELQKILIEYKSQLKELRKELGYIFMESSSSEDGILNIDYFKRLKITQSMKKSLQNIGNDLSQHEKAIVSLALKKAYKNTYHNALVIIEDGLRNDSGEPNSSESGENNVEVVEMLEAEKVDKAVNEIFKGDTFSNRITKNNEQLINEVHGVVKTGLDSGKSVSQINQEVTRAFEKGAFRSQRLFETEMFRVFNKALIGAAIEKELHKVRYDAQLDDRCCSECASLSGQVFDIGYEPSLPRHPKCRCIYTYIYSLTGGSGDDYDDWEEDGEY